MPVIFPGHDLDFGGHVTVATAPDANFLSHTTLPPATSDRFGGPSGFPYSRSKRGDHGQPLSEVHEVPYIR
jgi:hypothetical protein